MEDKNSMDTLGIVEVDNKDLTKAELLKKLETIEKAHNNLQQEFNKYQDQTQESYEELHKYFENVLTNKDKQLNYYVRKFKLISDIIHIEEDPADNIKEGRQDV